MAKELLVSSSSVETRLAILEDGQVTEVFIERASNRRILGNIYKGKVKRVLPGMQAAFVNIGLERDTFLYVSDFSEEYEEFSTLLEGETDFEGVSAEGAEPEPESLDRERGLTTAPRFPAIGTILPGSLDSWSSSGSWKYSDEPEGHVPVTDGPSNVLPARLFGFERDHIDSSEPYLALEQSQDDPSQEVLEEPFEPGKMAQPKPVVQQQRSRRRNGGRRNQRAQIGDLLSEGQEILVQVAKEPIGKKGARITSHCVLPGRFIVYMPTVDHVGVSRKVVSDTERRRLRDIILRIREDDRMGFIVRTAGENCSEADLQRDVSYLTRLWEKIRQDAEQHSAPSLVYSEPKLSHRILRDYISDEYRAIRVNDEREYERIIDLVSQFNPDLVKKVRLYNKKKPIFDEYNVTSELEKALRQKVWLKSGGHIVINQTEALVSIDVNTGRYVGKTNSLEDTITQTNLDAVKEVARQVRLRDLGGIIVIDFIDMDERKNRQKVLSALQQELAKDKSPTRVLQFNEFGLVAITRKRVKQSLERLLCQPCAYCQGSGMTKSVRTVCHSIFEETQKILGHMDNGHKLQIRCHPDVGRALKTTEKMILKRIEEMTGKSVSVRTDSSVHIEQFEMAEV